MKPAPDLALEAVLAKEHNAGIELDHAAWVPFLTKCIEQARAQRDLPPDDRLPFLWQSVPHPILDEATSPGEVLQLFGLIVSAKDGILWNEA